MREEFFRIVKFFSLSTRKLRLGALWAGLLLQSAMPARADYHSTVQNDHPVAYYPLNASVDPTGTTATDLSGNGNAGTYNGTDPEYNTVPGPTPYLSSALLFDGFTSFVDLGAGSHPERLNFSGPITLEAWVQPVNTTEGLADILAKGYDSALNAEIALRANGGNYYGGSYNGSSHGGVGGQQTTDWAYVVCSYDGTNWNLYVNSILVQHSPDATGALAFSAPWRIGAGSGDVGSSRFFTGNLCDVALYTNALTAAQVLNHYYCGELNAAPAISAPLIVTPPQSQSVFIGGSVTFSVTAVSALSMTNQWLKNGIPLSGQTNATLTLSQVQPSDAADYTVAVGNLNGSTNSLPVSLAVNAPATLQWSAADNSGIWDTTNSANWINTTDGSPVVFNPGDQVWFDDTVGAPTNVTVSGSVMPGRITINASTNQFTFNGGAITGPGGLVKLGSSSLTILSAGSITGPVTIGGGSVFAGNNALSAAAAITITNSATLDLAGGTLNANQPLTVSGPGLNGTGALYNSFNDIPVETVNIMLAGNTVFGGSARWDLVGGSISGAHQLAIRWSDTNGYGEWNGVTIATNVGNLELAAGKLGLKNMGATFGNPASTFTVDFGAELDFWTGDAGYGKNIHILNGGLMQILTTVTNFNADLTLEEGALLKVIFGSGNQSLNGALTLNGMAHLKFGDGDILMTNVIRGSGGFIRDKYNHRLILQASNTYTGPTIIGSDGNAPILALSGNGSIAHSSLIFMGGSTSTNVTLDASGRPDNTWTLFAGQTLSGMGIVIGQLTVSSGAVVSPAGTNTTLGLPVGTNLWGTIAATSDLTLNGTTSLKLNGSGVSDQLLSATRIIYGGTLNLVNISTIPLAAGDSFQLFKTPVYSGAFTNLIPATPGAGLAWDTSQLSTTGFLRVAAASDSGLVVTHSAVSGRNFIFSGSGGPGNGSYAVLTTTNLIAPLADWISLMTNSFDAAGHFSFTNPVSADTPRQFYRLQQLP